MSDENYKKLIRNLRKKNYEKLAFFRSAPIVADRKEGVQVEDRPKDDDNPGDK